MEKLLQTLYDEYRSLQEKQKVIATTILAYGGTIPSFPAHQHSEDVINAMFEDFASYPSEGTWKDKIVFALNEIGHPATVGTLSEVIKKYQPKMEMDKIVMALTQNCSNLAVSNIIEVEKGYRNKYFLKQLTTHIAA